MAVPRVASRLRSTSSSAPRKCVQRVVRPHRGALPLSWPTWWTISEMVAGAPDRVPIRTLYTLSQGHAPHGGVGHAADGCNFGYLRLAQAVGPHRTIAT